MGIAAGLANAANSVLFNAPVLHTALNIAAAAVFLLMYLITKKTGQYRFCYISTVIAVFMVIFPVLYFTGNGYSGAIPKFFIFAVVFTALIPEGTIKYIFAVCEFIIFSACFFIEYRFFGSLAGLSGDFSSMGYAYINFVTKGVLLFAAVTLCIRIYDNHKARLDEMNKMKSEFLSNMSHELRTPLTCVYGFAHLSFNVLSEDWPLNDEGLYEIRDNLRLIAIESSRMKRIVEQLLDISAIEQGKLTLEKEAMKISELIEAIRNIHFKPLNTNENSLHIEIPPDLPSVSADRDRLVEVLLNLVSNALRHTKNGLIKITAKAENNCVLLSVSDNGEGIPDKLLDRVFERHLYAYGNTHGTGLGLHICKKIIEAHGGEINIESKPGAGTDVRFTIPVEQAV